MLTLVAPRNDIGLRYGGPMPRVFAVDVGIVTASLGPLLDNPEPVNASLVIELTEAGIVIDFNKIQLMNA